LKKKKYDVHRINRNIIDAYKITTNDLYNILETYQAKKVIVINCIGIIPQRNNMEQSKIYIKVNSLFPHFLAYCCEKLHYQMVHITTDCVYDGLKGNYSEDDPPDESNIYGVTKSLGEPSNCCVIRTSIIGEEARNKKSLLEWVKHQNGNIINGFVNHYWNGVTCLQVSKIINHMIENNIFWLGVRHIHSPKSVSKYELISMIIEIYDLNITINKLETPISDKTLTSKYQFIDIPDLYEQIKELREFFIQTDFK